MSDKKTITVQLAKSVAGTRESHRATIRGLGLRKLGSTLRSKIRLPYVG